MTTHRQLLLTWMDLPDREFTARVDRMWKEGTLGNLLQGLGRSGRGSKQALIARLLEETDKERN